MEEGDAPDISIFQAAIVGNSVAVAQHIAAGTDLNQTEDFGGSTPLVLAAIFGQSEVAKILIEAGANLEVRNNSDGTALHQASFFCRPRMVELLLQSGADPNKKNGRNLTPLEVVAIEWDSELEGVYRYVYGSLSLNFDVQHVRQTRRQIAEILSRHADDDAGEEANREMETAK
jgi:ankyrin repeat protein